MSVKRYAQERLRERPAPLEQPVTGERQRARLRNEERPRVEPVEARGLAGRRARPSSRYWRGLRSKTSFFSV